MRFLGPSLLLSFLCFSSSYSQTPEMDGPTEQLFHGINSENIAEVKRSLREGANPDFSEPLLKFGMSPFITAVIKGNFEIYKLLKAARQNPNARDNFGNTAFHYAGQGSSTEIFLDMLDDPEVDLFAMNRKGEHILQLLEHRGRQDFIDAFFERITAMSLEEDDQTHVLVFNFLGFGGGGSIYSEQLTRIAAVDEHFTFNRSWKDLREAKKIIRSWMRYSTQEDGPRKQSIVVVGASWGASMAEVLSNWFTRKYGEPPMLGIHIDAANFLGLPLLTMGRAQRRINLYNQRLWTFPTGWRAFGRQIENRGLGDVSHNDSLFIGARQAEAEVIEALVNQCRSSD